MYTPTTITIEEARRRVNNRPRLRKQAWLLSSGNGWAVQHVAGDRLYTTEEMPLQQARLWMLNYRISTLGYKLGHW